MLVDVSNQIPVQDVTHLKGLCHDLPAGAASKMGTALELFLWLKQVARISADDVGELCRILRRQKLLRALRRVNTYPAQRCPHAE
mmetsp:Transcript_7506/g.31780  ORF Transcript_7506/g.31780 Transcript_7506/m.31780 type:complete len:85 (-) Transcript_7506:45-299(-)